VKRFVLRAGAEDGWAVVTACAVLALMLGLGLASYSFVNTQQRESGIERNRESTFNVTEGVLNGQIFALSRKWPAPTAAGTAPAAPKIYGTCTQALADDRCPSPTDTAALFKNVDQNGGIAWRTNVYDNGGTTSESYYSETVTPTQPGWDQNDDGKMWVRAKATVRGKTRTIVALVRSQQQLETLPRVAAVAGSIDISNNGKKVLIDANGLNNQYSPALVAVRCDASQVTCFNSGKPNDQLDPPGVQGNYQVDPILATDAQTRLMERANQDGTHYTSCAEAQAKGLAGAVVWVDAPGTCSFTGSNQWNTPEEPGLLVWTQGTLVLGGTTTYYGAVYHLHSDSAKPALETQGDAQVYGAVMVDGDGRLVIGSSKQNIVFDERAVSPVKSYGTAGIIQNTWREIKPGF
jgi:hypothetical protein